MLKQKTNPNKVNILCFNLKVRLYCEHKRIRTLTFESVHIDKKVQLKTTWSRDKLKYNTNYSKGLTENKNYNFK